MILVVGGLASGKRTFARSLGFAADQMAFDVQDDVADRDEAGLAFLVDELADKRVVTCCEVGSGIVPLDAGERLRRERAGRLMAQLAERADIVVRMVCGIPQVLKGDPAALEQRSVRSRP